MWGTILNVNSALWVLTAIYLVYALGLGILTWAWKPFFIALLVILFLTAAEFILAALTD